MRDDYTMPDDGDQVFNPQQAKWVMRLLGLMIDVVGAECPEGEILCLARAEIACLLRDNPQCQDYDQAA